MRLHISRLLLAFVFSLTVFATAFSQSITDSSAVPKLVRFNGTLAQHSPDQVVGVTFALYKDQQGGAPLWLETQNVTVNKDGAFTVLLGANHAAGIPADLFAGGEARWLGIQADGQPEQERVFLVSVPYALKAADADTLGGKPLSAFVLTDQSSNSTSTSEIRVGLAGVQLPGVGITPAVSTVTADSGALNSIPKFSSTTNLANSAISDVSGNVGIGTKKPESILDIAASSAQTVRFGTVPWALRIGSLQAGTQFIGLAVKKTGANNNYVASSNNVAAVNHTVMEFAYDGSWRIRQQSHQPDGTVLALKTTLGINPAGQIGVGTDTPTEKLELNGNLKIDGTGNGIMFPDGTLLKTAQTSGSGTTSGISGVTAGTGLLGGGTTGTPELSLNTNFTDVRYARISAPNTFSGDQSFGGAVTVTGALTVSTQVVTGVLTSAAQVVNGDIASAGIVSGQRIQAHVPATVPSATAVSAAVDGNDGIGVDVSSTATDGAPTAIHASVSSASGVPLIIDNTASGNLLVGRIKVGDYWVKKFRIDGAGKAYAAGGFLTGGADFAESFSVQGAKSQYEPGEVLVIDTTATRQLAKSTSAYSTLVAGVYSTKPGVLGSPYNSVDPNLEKEIPLAVVGVVPCKVTTENGPVHPGDLLVTSSTSGFAMKGTDHSRMVGAVIGKALQSLNSGSGVIQILVSLQ